MKLETVGATIEFQQSGEGRDLLWLAAGDQPGDVWRRWQTPFFDYAFRSTTFDARGVSATRSKSDPPWPIVEHARDAAQLIEGRCSPPVFLVGLSMGSLIAREVEALAKTGTFHLLEGLGHGSAFGHRPDVVNRCIASILAQHEEAAMPKTDR